jgi:AcrR family transcriptional regulator
MPRPVSIKDQTLIDAARAVFLERGFGATTAEVAERAGVSEGTLFNRFKSKAELFQAAMEPQLDQLEWLADLDPRVGQGELREHLHELGAAGIEFFRQLMPLVMMSYANPTPSGLPEALTQPNPPPLRALRHLSSYFEAEIRLGRLRPSTPNCSPACSSAASNSMYSSSSSPGPSTPCRCPSPPSSAASSTSCGAAPAPSNLSPETAT